MIKAIALLSIMVAVCAAKRPQQHRPHHLKKHNKQGDGDICVTSWDPYYCDTETEDSDGESNCVGWDRYETVEDCGGMNTPAAFDGWCVCDWNPKTCCQISDGCNGYWYPPPYGYADEDSCLNLPTPSPSPTDNDWCVTDWSFRDTYLCGQEWDFECVGWGRYDSLEDCGGDSAYNWDDESELEYGWCVVSWWDSVSQGTTCEMIAGGNCIGWYPHGGWDSQDECEGNSKKSNIRHEQSHLRKIDARKVRDARIAAKSA